MSRRDGYSYSRGSQQWNGQHGDGSAFASAHGNPPAYADISNHGHQEYAQCSSSNTIHQQQQNQVSLQTELEEGGSPHGSIYAHNKDRFDSPFAHNSLWSPTQEDYQLRQLPKIDFMLKVKARLARGAGNPFDPEPISFARPVPRSAVEARAYGFRPIIIQPEGKSGFIGGGFKPNYFGPLLASHDVSAADYARFLEDIFTAGKISGVGHIVATAAPIAMHAGLTGFLITKAITKALARRNEPLVVETIETWQERFFGPRGLDVYAAQEGERATASHIGLTPGPLSSEVSQLIGREFNSSRNSLQNDHESDSQDSDTSHDSHGHKLSRDERNERRRQQKKEKKERKERKKKEKKEKKERKEKEKKQRGKHRGPFLVIAPLSSSFLPANGPPNGGYGY